MIKSMESNAVKMRDYLDFISLKKGALVYDINTEREGSVVKEGKKYCLVDFDGKEEVIETSRLRKSYRNEDEIPVYDEGILTEED